MSKFGSPSRSFNYTVDESCTWNRIWTSSLHDLYRINPPNERSTDSKNTHDLVFNISESETEARLELKKKNVAVHFEKEEKSIDVVTTNANEKNLETLWKLYHDAGETIEDVQERFFGSTTSNASCLDFEELDFFVGNDAYNDLGNYQGNDNNESKFTKSAILNGSCNSEDFHNISDLLDIEIQELDRQIQLLSGYDVESISESVEWTYNTAIEHLRNSESLESSPNCTYGVPRLKKITNAELVTSERDKRRRPIKSTNVEVQTKKDRILSDSEDNEPVICNMYGVTTYNYNDKVPRMKIPDCFKISRLSGSSSGEETGTQFSNGGHSITYKTGQPNKLFGSYCFINRQKRKRVICDYTLSSCKLSLSSDSNEEDNIKNFRKAKKQKISFIDNSSKSNNSSTSETPSSSSLSDSTTDAFTCDRSSCSCSSTSSDE